MQLLPRILTAVWAIEPSYASGYLPLVSSLLQGKTEVSERVETTPPVRKSVTRLHLRHPITKYDQYCGPAGTKSMSEWLKALDKDENVGAVLLEIDSGGGEAGGTAEFAEAIRNFSKPIWAYVDGMACSAAYWIAAACDEIVASNNTDIVGSIGTLLSFMDFRPHFEKEGVKIHEIYATLSTEKNKEFREALKGNYAPMRTNLLDPMNLSFHNAIRAYRPQVDGAVFSGSVYNAEKALALGLIDRVDTYENTVKRLSEFSTKFEINMSTTAQERSLLTAFRNFFAVAQKDETADELAVAQQEVVKVHTENAELIGRLEAAEKQLASFQENLSAAQEQIKTLSAELQSWKDEAMKLGATAQPAFPIVAAQGDDNPAQKPVELSSDLQYAAQEFGIVL